nr:alginate export family protein [Flavobacterium sp. Sd200]
MQKDTARSLYKSIKHIPLGKDSTHYASVGGDVRLQYIITKNNKWGDDPDEADGYILSRYLMHADVHFGRARAFVQLQSSLSSGLTDPSPVDKNTADIHQAFIDVVLLSAPDKQIITRAGRQELLYGSQRLIGVREGPNNRMAFDALNVIMAFKNVRTDAFYTHPVANMQGAFDDKFNDNAKLWGSYTVLNNIPIIKNIDLYYLGFWKRNSVFDDVRGRELRHSFGTRIWKNKGNLAYDLEVVYQFGNHAGKDITAYTISSNTTYTFQNVKYSPVVGLKTEIISGDKHTGDQHLETFNALYPRGAYFGLVALIGPANLYDIHPSIDVSLTKTLSLGADYDIFWRLSKQDGLYAPNMQLLYSGDHTQSSFIGTQLGSNLEYSPNNYLSFTLEGAWFNAGAFLKEAGSGKDYFYAAFTSQLQF